MRSRDYEVEELVDEEGDGCAWRARGWLSDGQVVEETEPGPLLALDALLTTLDMDYYEKWGGKA